MQDPICPFDQYDAYMELSQIAPERRLIKLKQLLQKLPPLNHNTLKFIIEFMREVVVHEPQNRMTSYNIAVTVGPNIFRSLTVRPADLYNAGTYYDVIIRCMEHFEILFEDAPIPNAEEFDLNAQIDKFADSNVSRDTVQMNLGKNRFMKTTKDMLAKQQAQDGKLLQQSADHSSTDMAFGLGTTDLMNGLGFEVPQNNRQTKQQ